MKNPTPQIQQTHSITEVLALIFDDDGWYGNTDEAFEIVKKMQADKKALVAAMTKIRDNKLSGKTSALLADEALKATGAQ